MARVLVVDDSRLSRKILADMIKQAGHEVLEAPNGCEAVKMVETEDLDCVFLDLLMPEMDGFGVLSSLREKSLSVPVTILSADIQETTKKRCLELGAFGFLNKPQKREEVLKAIDDALNHMERE